MRIGLIAPPFIPVPPRLYGGTELFIAHLAEGLERCGIDVVVYSNGESTVNVENRFLYNKMEWPVLSDIHAQFKDANHSAWAVQDAAKSCDIIHLNNATGLTYSRFVDRAFVYTVHHPKVAELSEYYRSYPDTTYVTISEAQRYLENMPRMQTIHHGIAMDSYPLVEEKQPYLAFLGRIAPIKGVHLAIEVAKRSGVPLKIAGEVQPIFQSYFDAEIRPHIDGRFIEYLGPADLAAKNELLGNAMAMLFPIQWDEPFGLVMIESMACGTPVIALEGGSVGEVVKDGVSGWVCTSVDQLVEAVQTLDLRSEAVRRYAEERFSVDIMVEHYLRLYGTLIHSSLPVEKWPLGKKFGSRMTDLHRPAPDDATPFYRGVRLESVDCPPEPKIAYRSHRPHKVDNLTLIDGRTFLASTIAGDIMPPGAPDVGFFSYDTRFLSHLELKVGGQNTILLSSSTERTYASQIEMTMKAVSEESTMDIPENMIYLRREQLLADGILFDSLRFENFSDLEQQLKLEITLDADFMDIFQVRGMVRGLCGQYFKPVIEPDGIIFIYRGRDGVERTTTIRFFPAPSTIAGHTAQWDLRLPPLARIDVLIRTTPRAQAFQPASAEREKDDAKSETPRKVENGARAHLAAAHSDYGKLLDQRRDSFSHWQKESTSFRSSNQVFDRLLMSSVGDFHALRVPEGDQHIIAAGIPWFDTIFGRDSLIAAYQALVLNPQLSADTLRVLAHYQGKVVDDFRDEAPGKILHEHRSGEMSQDREVPFGDYYGSVDATPLYMVLFTEVLDWLDDPQLYADLLPAAQAAMDWVDRYGDLDGDGLTEFERRSPRGLLNQGWKDSGDANAFADGTLAKAPIALIEVQGYVYAAKHRMAALAERHGDHQQSVRLENEAKALRERIDRAFWMPDRHYYAMALDRDKRQLQVVSSNPGHLLFTGAISQERAEDVAQACLREGLNCGWGIRTLSQEERTFNPMSYHRGSVWPHDNSLIVHGMARYGFRKRAAQVCSNLYEAALNFRDYRLPELFCGIQRKPYAVPVEYPVSCSPQAWASGSMLLMLSSLLGLRPNAHLGELRIVDPVLPPFIDWLHLRNLRVGHSRIGLDFSRHEGRTFCNVVDVQGDPLRVAVISER